MTKNYRVSVTLFMEADSPDDAARQAADYLSMEAGHLIYVVGDTTVLGDAVNVDLDLDEKED